MMAFAIDGFGWTVLHSLWQCALIGASAALILRALRRAHPGYRHAVATIALLACLIWPALDLAARTMAAWSDSADMTVLESLGAGSPTSALQSAAEVATASTGYVMAIWLIGVLLLGARTGAGLAWVKRSADGPAAPAWEARAGQLARRMGITRTVRVRFAAGLDSPVTAGWRHPLILLPAALTETMPTTQLDALLAHELAHVKRHDYLRNLLSHLIVTLLFFHPIAWWLSRRISAERELLADALAVTAMADPRALAEALAELDRYRHARMPLMQAATGGELVARVRALVRPEAAALKLHLVIPAVALSMAGVALAADAAGGVAGQALTSRAVVEFDSCSKPRYPAEALAAGHTGTVTLRFQVDRDGAVVDGTVLHPSGHDTLDQAALAGIMQCRFQPAQLKGMPVVSWTNIQYIWTLK